MLKQILILTGFIVFGVLIINPIAEIDGLVNLGFYFWSATLTIGIIMITYKIWADFDFIKEEIKDF